MADLATLIVQMRSQGDRETLRALRGIRGEIVGVDRALTGMLTRLAGGYVGLRAISATIKEAMNLQNLRVAFETMLGTAEKAEILINKLRGLSAQTGFDFDQIAKGAKLYLALGGSARTAERDLRAVSAQAAAMGKGAEQIDRVVLALGQIKAKGFLSGEEVRQLANNNVKVWEYLTKVLRVDVSTAMDMARKKMIDADTAVEAILKGLSEEFGPALEKRLKTVPGAFDALVNDIKRQMASVGEAIFGAIGAVDALQTTRILLRSWGDVLGDAIRILGGVEPKYARTIEQSRQLAEVLKVLWVILQAIIALRVVVFILDMIGALERLLPLLALMLAGFAAWSLRDWLVQNKGFVQFIDDLIVKFEQLKAYLDDTFNKKTLTVALKGLDVRERETVNSVASRDIRRFAPTETQLIQDIVDRDLRGGQGGFMETAQNAGMEGNLGRFGSEIQKIAGNLEDATSTIDGFSTATLQSIIVLRDLMANIGRGDKDAELAFKEMTSGLQELDRAFLRSKGLDAIVKAGLELESGGRPDDVTLRTAMTGASMLMPHPDVVAIDRALIGMEKLTKQVMEDSRTSLAEVRALMSLRATVSSTYLTNAGQLDPRFSGASKESLERMTRMSSNRDLEILERKLIGRQMTADSFSREGMDKSFTDVGADNLLRLKSYYEQAQKMFGDVFKVPIQPISTNLVTGVRKSVMQLEAELKQNPPEPIVVQLKLAKSEAEADLKSLEKMIGDVAAKSDLMRIVEQQLDVRNKLDAATMGLEEGGPEVAKEWQRLSDELARLNEEAKALKSDAALTFIADELKRNADFARLAQEAYGDVSLKHLLSQLDGDLKNGEITAQGFIDKINELRTALSGIDPNMSFRTVDEMAKTIRLSGQTKDEAERYRSTLDSIQKRILTLQEENATLELGEPFTRGSREVAKFRAELELLGKRSRVADSVLTAFRSIAGNIVGKFEIPSGDRQGQAALDQLESLERRNETLKVYESMRKRISDLRNEAESLELGEPFTKGSKEIAKFRAELELLEKKDRAVASVLNASRAVMGSLVQGIKVPESRGQALLQELEALERHNETLREIKGLAEDMGQAFGDAFMDMATGAKTAGEALEDLLRSVSSMVLRQAVAQPLANFVSGGLQMFIGALLGMKQPMTSAAASNIGGAASVVGGPAAGLGSLSAMGNVFDQGRITHPFAAGGVVGPTAGLGSFIKNEMGNVMDHSTIIHPFAAGGVVNQPILFPMLGGRQGLMGESGPEAIMPLRRGRDGRLGVAADGGGGNQTIVNMNVKANDAASFKRSQSQTVRRLKSSMGI